MTEACFIELFGHREVDSPTLCQTAGSSDLSAVHCAACPSGRPQNDHSTSASDGAVVPLNPLALKD